MEFSHIVVHDVDSDGDVEGAEDVSASDPPIWSEVLDPSFTFYLEESVKVLLFHVRYL